MSRCMIAVCLVGIQSLGFGCGQPAAGPIKVNEVSGVKNLSQDGRLYVAGAPSNDGLEGLQDRGVKTVIDLRGSDEVSPADAQAARDRGMTYVHIPMKSDELTEEQIEEFLRAMREGEDDPVLIHCAGGNRAGAMYGLYLGKSGQCSAEEALRRARAAGLKNAKLEGDVVRAMREDSRPADSGEPIE